MRVLAACFQLASIKHPTNSVYGGALICQGIGLGPLTQLNSGLFQRLNKFVGIIHEYVFSAITLISIAGIVCAIIGGTNSANSPTLATNDLLKASVMLFLACYVAFTCLFLVLLWQWRAIPTHERKLLFCFASCVPFMVVRFLFGILGTYVETLRPRFSVLTGDVTTFLCMDVIEVIFVVAFFVFTGMRLVPLSPELKNGAKPRDSEGVVELASRE